MNIYIDNNEYKEQKNKSVKTTQNQKWGEWIFNPKDAIELMFMKPKCSKCDFESSDGGNFCSNCGAKMKGADNDS